MKQVLSKDQVNDNLLKANNTALQCYKVDYGHYNNEPYYYFTLREKALIVAFGKKVFYHELHEPNIVTHKGIELVFENREYVPLVDKKDHENLLVICGLKPEKKINPITPEQRLKQLECHDFAAIYKIMKGLTGLRGELETRYKANRYGLERPEYGFLALVVYHDKGSFSFPIENITGNADHDDEIQNIFFTALDMKLTNQIAV